MRRHLRTPSGDPGSHADKARSTLSLAGRRAADATLVQRSRAPLSRPRDDGATASPLPGEMKHALHRLAPAARHPHPVGFGNGVARVLEIYLVTLAGIVLGQIAPGPNLLAVAGAALGQDRRTAFFLALGVATAIFVWVTVAAFGLAALLKLYPSLLTVMKFLGGGYLCFLSIRALIAAWRGGETCLPGESGGADAARGVAARVAGQSHQPEIRPHVERGRDLPLRDRACRPRRCSALRLSASCPPWRSTAPMGRCSRAVSPSAPMPASRAGWRLCSGSPSGRSAASSWPMRSARSASSSSVNPRTPPPVSAARS